MSDYKRLVSYIYSYPGGEKDKNVGFVKAEVRNGQFKLTISLKGVYTNVPETFGVYLMVDQDENVEGRFTLLKIGDIRVNAGMGEFQAILNPQNIENTLYSFNDIAGIAIGNPNDQYYMMFTLWQDIEVNPAAITFAPEGYQKGMDLRHRTPQQDGVPELEPGPVIVPDDMNEPDMEPGPVIPEDNMGPGPVIPEDNMGPGPVIPEDNMGPGPVIPEDNMGPGPVIPEDNMGPGPVEPEDNMGPGPVIPDANMEPGPEVMPENRPGFRPGYRPGGRQNIRPDYRQDGRSNGRPDNRQGQRPGDRQDDGYGDEYGYRQDTRRNVGPGPVMPETDRGLGSTVMPEDRPDRNLEYDSETDFDFIERWSMNEKRNVPDLMEGRPDDQDTNESGDSIEMYEGKKKDKKVNQEDMTLEDGGDNELLSYLTSGDSEIIDKPDPSEFSSSIPKVDENVNYVGRFDESVDDTEQIFEKTSSSDTNTVFPEETQLSEEEMRRKYEALQYEDSEETEKYVKAAGVDEGKQDNNAGSNQRFMNSRQQMQMMRMQQMQRQQQMRREQQMQRQQAVRQRQMQVQAQNQQAQNQQSQEQQAPSQGQQVQAQNQQSQDQQAPSQRQQVQSQQLRQNRAQAQNQQFRQNQAQVQSQQMKQSQPQILNQKQMQRWKEVPKQQEPEEEKEVVPKNGFEAAFETKDFIDAFDDDYFYDCVEVSPEVLRAFPVEDESIINNSFLIHGFYNYKHILFGRVRENDNNTKYFLGVPGMYCNRERFMASMFGFNNFKKSHRSDYTNPYFGYWYQEL